MLIDIWRAEPSAVANGGLASLSPIAAVLTAVAELEVR